ncbi:MAG: isochorismatase family protein [Patescibacteria group bacterium]
MKLPVWNPQKVALIVVDMQNDFYGPDGCFARMGKPVSNMQSLVPKVNELSSKLREKGSLIVFTQYISGKTISPPNSIEHFARHGYDFICTPDSDGVTGIRYIE